MTVAELIELLRREDPSAVVEVEADTDYGFAGGAVDHVEVEERIERPSGGPSIVRTVVTISAVPEM